LRDDEPFLSIDVDQGIELVRREYNTAQTRYGAPRAPGAAGTRSDGDLMLAADFQGNLQVMTALCEHYCAGVARYPRIIRLIRDAAIVMRDQATAQAPTEDNECLVQLMLGKQLGRC
jgi:hypothetical protein